MQAKLDTVFRRSNDGGVELVGSRCAECRQLAFPARQVCASCLGREQVMAPLSGRGVVVGSALVMTPPAGFEEQIVVGLVQLEEGPDVFALLSGEPLPTAGDPVVATPAQVRDGSPGFAFQARP